MESPYPCSLTPDRVASTIKEGEIEGQPCRMQGVCGREQAGMKTANDTLNLVPPGVVVLRPYK